MKIKWHPEAIEEFLSLDSSLQNYIEDKIQRLPEKGLKRDKVGRVNREKIGLDAYRLKLNPEEEPDINHRVIFDIADGNYEIILIDIRPDFYDIENLEKAKNRIRN